jgi:hypothetical protein
MNDTTIFPFLKKSGKILEKVTNLLLNTTTSDIFYENGFILALENPHLNQFFSIHIDPHTLPGGVAAQEEYTFDPQRIS